MATNITRFTVSPDICSSSNENGSILLDVEKGLLYSIIGIGSLIWTKLTLRPEGLTLDDIVSSIRIDFNDVPEQRVRDDVRRLLGELKQKGIVRTNWAKPDLFRRAAQTLFITMTEMLSHPIVRILMKLRLTYVAAVFELALVDLTLKLGGFRALHHLVGRWAVTKTSDCLEAQQRIHAAMDRATTFYPKQALCLQRSAATTCLLRVQGLRAQMVIGCKKMPFNGHAWVEIDGEVVNDNPKVQTFYNQILERT